MEYELFANPENVNRGFYDASSSPILSIQSGDTLRVHTESGLEEHLELVGERASDEFRAIIEKLPVGPGPHILIGPIAIEDASPGDVLEVQLEDISPRYDWGYNGFRPLMGGLPEDFPYRRTVIVEIDKELGVADWGAGIQVPLSPYFGNFGVAPPASMGKIGSYPPGTWGGNMDNKELVSGSKVFFPVFNEKALFSIGDGHGCQGDGEVCLTALECAMSGTLKFKIHKNLFQVLPRAETSTHHIFMGFDPLIDNAVKIALRETIKFMTNEYDIHRDDGYTICSLAVDLRVTQIVNGVKGVHAMLPKNIFQ